jgi:hypothetical protein
MTEKDDALGCASASESAIVSECDACGRQECFDGLIVECFVCITAVLIACTVRRTVVWYEHVTCTVEIGIVSGGLGSRSHFGGSVVLGSALPAGVCYHGCVGVTPCPSVTGTPL